MNLPRSVVSGLLLAALLPVGAFAAQTPARELNSFGVDERRNGNLDAAIAAFTQAISLDPTYAVAYSNRGGAKRAKGDLDGAIADFTKAVEIDPGYATGYNNRGSAKLRKKDLDGAIADFTKAIELDPKHEVGVNNLAVAKKLKASPQSDAWDDWNDQQRRLDASVDAMQRVQR